jgi:hypothetical protein
MFDRFPAQAHGLRVRIKALLHGIEQRRAGSRAAMGVPELGTVLLCLQRNASHFRILLLLFRRGFNP